MEDLQILKIKQKKLVVEYNKKCMEIWKNEYYEKISDLNKKINTLQYLELVELEKGRV